jgi:hypothetical protein
MNGFAEVAVEDIAVRESTFHRDQFCRVTRKSPSPGLSTERRIFPKT